mgnify:FL=1
MRKTGLVVFLTVISVFAFAAASEPQNSEVAVEVDSKCDVGIYNFEVPGQGDGYPKIIGKGATDFFSGTVANTGNQNATVQFDLNLYEVTENGTLVEQSVADQSGNYTYNFSLPHENFNENVTRYRDFISEFNASYPKGGYRGAL